MFWNWKASTIFCTWDGPTYWNGTVWGLGAWGAAPKEGLWGLWRAASWTWARGAPQAADSSFLLGGWGENGAGLYTDSTLAGRDNNHELRKGRFRQDKRRNFFSLSDQPEWHPGRSAACPERLCSLCLWSFQDPNGKSTEQPGLVSQLTLLGTGGWTRDLLRVPSNINDSMLWFCCPSGFCSLTLLHIFGYSFLCKYLDYIHLINKKLEFITQGRISRGKKRNSVSSCLLPILKYIFWNLIQSKTNNTPKLRKIHVDRRSKLFHT